MSRWKPQVLFVVFGIVALVLFFFFFGALALVDRRLHALYRKPPATVPKPALMLHESVFVADLHADSLAWGRDLLKRNRRGHVDLPRLREGGVALQVFTVFTKIPFGLNINRTKGDSDVLPVFALAARWPRATWWSPRVRALYLAHEAHALEKRAHGELIIVRSRRDLARLVSVRSSQQAVGMVLGLEGAHALEGSAEGVAEMFEAGYRVVGLVHFFDNEFGGSAHGIARGGLTDKGADLIRRMRAKGMLIDLAHASARLIDDALALAPGPVIVSHTGLRGVCNNQRNLSDASARAVARAGGVIGIGFWSTATCGQSVAAIAKSIQYGVALVGAEHIALGSDFDGAVRTPLDAAQLPELTAELMRIGLTNRQIELVLGANVLRVLEATLPE